MLELKFEIGQNALKFRIVFRLLIHEFRFLKYYNFLIHKSLILNLKSSLP